MPIDTHRDPNCNRLIARMAAFLLMVMIPLLAGAARAKSQAGSSAKGNQPGKITSPRVSLAPRFSPGQVFRYNVEFETTTSTTRSGLAKDPEGPSKLVITWDATVRMEVLPAGATAPDGIRLRTTYEKSTANVSSDTFDPAADETQQQYQKLAGKVIEFSLDAAGNVKSVSGLEGVVDGEKAANDAGEWIAKLNASTGAPPGGNTVGQKWVSNQVAKELPIGGLIWRTESEYLRNEACHPPNPDVPGNPEAPGAALPAEPSGNSEPVENCAVILADLNLVRPKSVRNPTPEEYGKNGVQTAGTWSGSSESLTYVSLRTGMVVSVSQTGTQKMDVTLTTNRNTSMRYAGTVTSRSQVVLDSNEIGGK
jgi:hypothetical protein